MLWLISMFISELCQLDSQMLRGIKRLKSNTLHVSIQHYNSKKDVWEHIYVFYGAELERMYCREPACLRKCNV